MASLEENRYQQPAGQVVGVPAQASRNEAGGAATAGVGVPAQASRNEADGAATAGIGQAARRTLAGIRVINGGLALIAPSVIIRRFGEQSADGSAAANSAAIYGLRMFGIRTVLLGVDLATLSGEPLRRALRQAIVIHATDTATVVLLGVTGRAKPRTAIPLALISLTNTALATTACLAERSERHDTSQPSETQPGYRNSFFWRIYDEAAQAADRAVGWDKLPRALGLLVLGGLRDILRQRNLHDTSALPSAAGPKVPAPGPEMLTTRTPDGSYNDLDHPAMGMAGTRFGRNVPLEYGYQEAPGQIMEPSPREVSRELLTRHEFIPATSLNLMAAAWVQFMVKDWLSHGPATRSTTSRCHSPLTTRGRKSRYECSRHCPTRPGSAMTPDRRPSLTPKLPGGTRRN